MNFYFQDSIWIFEDDLKEMVSRVKNGEDFKEVYDDIASGWDDMEYYASSFVENDVKEEIFKRINNT